MSPYRPKLIETAFIDFIADKVSPQWSTTPKLCILSKTWLAPDLVALRLAPNAAYLALLKQARQVSQSAQTTQPAHKSAWQAGQHVTISPVIDDIRHPRSYSLVGLPHTDLLRPQAAIYLSGSNKSAKPDGLTAVSALKRGVQRRLRPLARPPVAMGNPPNNAPQTEAKLADTMGRKDSHQRELVYDLQTYPASSVLTIAIKPQGLVSNHLAHEATVGTWLDASEPMGSFTLDAKLTSSTPVPASATFFGDVAFVASGSGITPMIGLVQQALTEAEPAQQVHLLYYAREPVLPALWQHLQRQYANFTCHLVHTDDPSTYVAGQRHLNEAVISTLGLNKVDRLYACGSPALLMTLSEALIRLKASKPTDAPHPTLLIEQFDTSMSPQPLPTLTDPLETQPTDSPSIFLQRRGRQLSVIPSLPSILASAEAQHVRLPYGCRQGICNLCRCTKLSGVVQDVRTGERSTSGQESIKLCINTPITDVLLDV